MEPHPSGVLHAFPGLQRFLKLARDASRASHRCLCSRPEAGTSTLAKFDTEGNVECELQPSHNHAPQVNLAMYLSSVPSVRDRAVLRAI